MAVVKDIIARTAKALTGSPSAAELREVRREGQKRLTEVERRLEAIREGGREYSRVLREGSADDLAKLDDEAKTLAAEEKQLRHRISELTQKQRRAEATEAVGGAKAMREKLNESLGEAEAAQQAYERARGAADRHIKAIRQAVQACEREGIDPAPLLLDAAAIERTVALLEPQGRKTKDEMARELRRDIGAPAATPEPRREPNTGALVG